MAFLEQLLMLALLDEPFQGRKLTITEATLAYLARGGN